MTTPTSSGQSFDFLALIKSGAQGAGLAFLLFAVILLIYPPPHFASWILIPFSFVTAGGAGGGVLFYLTTPLRSMGGWIRAGILIFCSLAYFIILWLSLIYALSLTGDWN